MTVRKVGIVGAGQMGTGIAQVFLGKRVEVQVFDKNQVRAESARSRIERYFERHVTQGKMSNDDQAYARRSLAIVRHVEELTGVDIVLEAVDENYETKKGVFENLARLLPDDVILASNTSTLSITLLGASISHPERVIGMHFMNPPTVMKGIELVPGLLTSAQTVARCEEVINLLGKDVIHAKDGPGFLANRILFPMLNEALHALDEGVSDRAGIDNGMKACCNLPMGPLELADLIGLDVVLNILEILHKELGERYRPSPLLRKYVCAGRLGRKSGAGFYEYDKLHS